MKKIVNPVKWVTFGLLVVYVISLAIPMIWALYTSFKTEVDYVNDSLSLPVKWIFENFVTVISEYKVPVSHSASSYFVYIEEMLLYSLIYAVGSAFAATFATCMVAYVTSRFNFFFNKVVFAIVVVTMTLPVVGALPSELQILRALNFYDNLIALIFLRGSFLGMYYLVFYATFSGIPKDFSEAAHIDGAGNWTILFRIMLPLVRNIFITIMLIRFVDFWNDYTVNITYIPSFPTLAYGLYSISQGATTGMTSTPMILMSCVVLIFPVLIFFIFFHKRLMGNISMGGIKE